VFVSHHTLKWTRTCRSHGRHPHAHTAHFLLNRHSKIVATVGNANAFRDIQTSYGSFDDYIWRFTGRHVIYETGMTTSPLSDAIAVDLKTYGMRFIGTTIVYAYLQSIGVINAHEPGCFLHRER